jgi:hypothetical protein
MWLAHLYSPCGCGINITLLYFTLLYLFIKKTISCSGMASGSTKLRNCRGFKALCIPAVGRLILHELHIKVILLNVPSLKRKNSWNLSSGCKVVSKTVLTSVTHSWCREMLMSMYNSDGKKRARHIEWEEEMWAGSLVRWRPARATHAASVVPEEPPNRDDTLPLIYKTYWLPDDI